MDDAETRPRFTVVVPAFNEERYLPACLTSLAGQDVRGGVEVIVVDNNSTDGTAEVARLHGAKVVHQPVAGVCAARQAGSAAACGQIIVSTDADTTFAPGWLARIDAGFDDPQVATVTGPPYFVDAPWWGNAYVRLLFGLVHLVFVTTGYVWYASATNIAFRREVFPGYDTTLTQGGDEWDLLRRLRRRGKVVFDLGNPTLTSSRRLDRGLVYNLLVTCLYYYVLGYLLNRLTHRTILGMAPCIRSERSVDRSWTTRLIQVTAAAALVSFLGLGVLEWVEMV